MDHLQNLVPRRLVSQCRFWDCRRLQNPYCSLNHEMLSASEEVIQRAIVVVDGFDIQEQERISQKILLSIAELNHCGVPALPFHVLQGNPWQMEELNSNRIEHESARDWLFTSDNARPGNIWQFYDNRKVAGNQLRRIRYNLRPQPQGSKYRVHHYSLENVVLNTSVFWIVFSEEPLAKQNAKRAITYVSNKEPKKVCQNDIDLLNPPAAELDKRKHELKHLVQSSNSFTTVLQNDMDLPETRKHELKHLVQSSNSFSTVLQNDMDLLNPPAELETRKHKLKHLVQSPNSFSTVLPNDIDLFNPPSELETRKHQLKHLVQSPNSFSTVLQNDINPLAEFETRKHKLKRLVQSPNYFFMDVKCQGCFSTTVCSHSHTAVDVKCQGCFNITDVSHSQTVVVCGNCQTVLGQQIPEYKKKPETELLTVEELESTKRLIEELKLNLDKAETEEKQAKRNSELAKLRVEEMEQGIAGKDSVATKAQLEASQARHTSAISEMESVKEELQTLQNEYDALVEENELAMKEAEEEVEWKVEEMPRLLQHH